MLPRLPALLLGALLLAAASSQAQTAAPFSPPDEQEILQRVNRERQSRGLATLVMDEHLRDAARRHSLRMASTGMVEHRIDGEAALAPRLQGLRFDESGENVALSSDAGAAHEALMRSPGHRANILLPSYNAVGIGVVRAAQGIYVTEDFAHRLPVVGVGEVEDRVALTLERLRRASGNPPLRRLAQPELRARACQMAAQDRLNPHLGMGPRVRNSVAFTAIDLSELPTALARLQSSQAGSFAVGACYQSSASYSHPVFWVLAATYE